MEENKKSYKEIEDQLKNRADEKQFEYDPADWKALEAMLDEDKKKGFAKKRLSYLTAILALLFISIIVYHLDKFYQVELMTNASKANLSIVDNGKLGTPEDLTPSTSAPSQKRFDQESTESINLSNSKESNLESIVKAEAPILMATQQPSRAILSADQHINESIINQDVISQLTSRGMSFQHTAYLEEAMQNTDMKNSDPINSRYDRGDGYANSSKKSNLTAFVEKDSNISGEIAKLDVVSIASLNVSEAELKNPNLVEIPKEIQNPKFFIGFNTGFESSKTEMSTLSKIDLNTGVKVGYGIGEKLQLIAGANYVVDRYMAMGEEYKITPKFRSTWGEPDHVTANCSMINTTIGLAYHFSGITNSGFSLSIGNVSNFMVDEMYDYHYTDAANDWTGQWTGAHQTIFSALEVGLHYKLKVADNSLITLGTYAKIPTRGVGHGDLMLNSYGVRLGFGLIK